MITNVSVKNWKKFDQQKEWSFDKGIQLIYGPNTSGKSSLLEAIYFAFFGVDEKVDGNPTYNSNEAAIVTVDFISNTGEKYRIIRSYKKIKRKEESFTLYKLVDGNEEFFSDNPQDAIKIYGNFEDIFTHIIFLKEGEIYRALSRMKSNLDEELAYLLNLQRFDVLRDKLRETRLKVIKKEKENVKKDPTFLSEKEINELNDKLNDLNEVKKKLEEEKSKFIDNRQTAQKKYSLTKKLRDLDSQKQKYGETIKTIRNKYENKESLIEFLDNEIESLENKYRQLELEYSKLSSEKAEKEGEKRRLNKLIIEIKSFKSSGTTTCPTCYQKVDPLILQEAMESFSKKVTKLENALSQLNYSIDTVNEEKRNISQKIKEIKEDLFELKNAKARISDVQEEMNEISENLNSLPHTEDIQYYSKQIQELEQKISETNVEIGTIEKKLSSSKQEGVFIDELEFQEKFIELVENKIAEYKDELLERKLDEIKSVIKEKWSEIWDKEIWSIEFDENLIPTISFKFKGTTIQQNLRSFSASEKILLSVILRAALIDKFLSVKTMILDDPSIFLDQESVKIAARFYRELIDKKSVEQIIMTTFDESFKELLKPEKVINLE
ncbi:MAG: AAA family ATPase [Candidatus Heimdallarchaeum endolithica]|uniref:AAA family ATPase n=1 Tax=Candidatus Heimdallarchaeum endolithica TaxID=2876572 RepID=A0A9Y1FNW8_9ARCH|nr:MAG: AAA family ATPase [Candidatus Heimdallarchaeum endolithica]